MSDQFPGTMRFADGSEARVELIVDEATLSLRSKGAELGAWSLKYCRVSREDQAVFTLSIDGEEVGFLPDDPYRFGLTAAQRFEATALADRIKVIREIPPPDADGNLPSERQIPTRLRLGFLLGAVIAAGIIAAGIVAWNAQGPAPHTTPIPSTTTTLPEPSIFDQPLVAFVDRWNRTVDDFGAPLRIVGVAGTEPFEVVLTSQLLLQTTTDPDGSLQRFVLTADPSGSSEDDRLTLAAWGIAIAVVEPGLDGGERRQLLVDLGIDVDDPDLAGLEGEVETARARYSLAYLHGVGRALFTVEQP